MSSTSPIFFPLHQQLLEAALAVPRSSYSHFELYGPLGSLLSCICQKFPMLITTPPHKRQGDEDPIELEGGGKLTTACFVVVKYAGDPDKPETIRRIYVMGLHIQRGDESAPAARARVARFLLQRATEDRLPRLCSILLLGNEIEVYSLTDGSPDATVSDEVMRFSNPAGPELKALIYKIALESSDDEESSPMAGPSTV
ncbi:hypothetical protein BDN70DRAFT_877248 [Pholiota conissans]|uniref:Uncharacterized protein n=1 Tax=Pholiota conissans TaxID=109636 RepID=A0A9P6D204_9AGAR|nr:hypothetical protein BDN70DRAFT_877248 [Pholiota conissans]